MANQNGLRRVEYKDPEGRLSLRLVPQDATDEEAEYGILVGPPPLTSLNLPLEVEVRLNNELFHRSIFTERDLKKRRNDAAAAVMAACRVNVDRIISSLYTKGEE